MNNTRNSQPLRGEHEKHKGSRKGTGKGTGMTPEINPPSGAPLPEANVDEAGRCLQTDTAEHTRPDTGAPCDDGRGGSA